MSDEAKFKDVNNPEAAQNPQEEVVPIAPPLKVLDYRTISKAFGWWQAVVLTESWGKRTINLYLWQEKDGKWRRKQKFTIHDRDKWELVVEAVESFLGEL